MGNEMNFEWTPPVFQWGVLTHSDVTFGFNAPTENDPDKVPIPPVCTFAGRMFWIVYSTRGDRMFLDPSCVKMVYGGKIATATVKASFSVTDDETYKPASTKRKITNKRRTKK